MRKSEFRVLIAYPNLSMMLTPSYAVGLFTAILKDQGYAVDLFDCTPYLGTYEFLEEPLPVVRANNLPGNKFPLIVQELTYEKVSSLLTKNIVLEHSVIQLSAASQGSLEPIWKPSVFKASKHWAYAAQWLGLALALIYLFVYFGYKQKK